VDCAYEHRTAKNSADGANLVVADKSFALNASGNYIMRLVSLLRLVA